MKSIFICLFFLFNIVLPMQAQFSESYIVNTKGEKIECLIKDLNWTHTPQDIQYKLTEKDEMKTVGIDEIKEFQVYGTGHFYKKFTYWLNSEEKTSFLRVLLEGKASLYELNDITQGLFFLYQSTDIPIQVLLPITNNSSLKEESFRKELFDNVFCENTKTGDIRELKYVRNDLITFFEKYNNCISAEFVNYNNKHLKTNFKYSVFGGKSMNFSNAILNIVNSSYTVSLPPSAGGGFYTYDANTISKDVSNISNIYTLGLELELMLNFNNLNWSFFTNPSFNLRNTSKTFPMNFESEWIYVNDIEIKNQNFFELPIGFRYYYYINQFSSVQIGFAHNFNFIINKQFFLDIDTNRQDMFEVTTNLKIPNNFSFNVGYTHKNKFNASMIYYPNREFKQGLDNIQIKNATGLNLKYFFN